LLSAVFTCVIDVSPLPASTASHCSVEAASTQQTVADTPQKPVDTSVVTRRKLNSVENLHDFVFLTFDLMYPN